MRSYSLNKLSNLLALKGKKQKSEKLILKSFKKLQKDYKKQVYDIYQIATQNLVPIFKLSVLRNKKTRKKSVTLVPRIVISSKSELTLAIKYIMKVIRKRDAQNTYVKLSNEILLSCQLKGDSYQSKLTEQQQVLLNKNTLLKFYRWKI